MEKDVRSECAVVGTSVQLERTVGGGQKNVRHGLVDGRPQLAQPGPNSHQQCTHSKSGPCGEHSVARQGTAASSSQHCALARAGALQRAAVSRDVCGGQSQVRPSVRAAGAGERLASDQEVEGPGIFARGVGWKGGACGAGASLHAQRLGPAADALRRVHGAPRVCGEKTAGLSGTDAAAGAGE